MESLKILRKNWFKNPRLCFWRTLKNIFQEIYFFCHWRSFKKPVLKIHVCVLEGPLNIYFKNPRGCFWRSFEKCVSKNHVCVSESPSKNSFPNVEVCGTEGPSKNLFQKSCLCLWMSFNFFFKSYIAYNPKIIIVITGLLTSIWAIANHGLISSFFCRVDIGNDYFIP